MQYMQQRGQHGNGRSVASISLACKQFQKSKPLLSSIENPVSAHVVGRKLLGKQANSRHDRPTQLSRGKQQNSRDLTTTFIISQHLNPKRPTHLFYISLRLIVVPSQTSIDRNNQRSLRVHSCPDQASNIAISKPTQPRSLARSLQPSAVRSRQTIS